MNYAVGEYFDKFIQEQVASGRFASGDDVVKEGLRLVEMRATRLQALREEMQAALEEGGSFTDDEVDEYLAAHDSE